MKMSLIYDSFIPFLGIYPTKIKSAYEIITYTPMFILAQFTLAKVWVQCIWQTTEDWIKMWESSLLLFLLKKKSLLAL